MKNFILCFIFALAPELVSAQNVQSEDSIVNAVKKTHILFEGIELKGNIRDFSQTLKENGFEIKTRKGDSNYYIFQGTVCGHSTYFEVSYTPESKTVYRVKAEPKNVNINDLVDSLKVRYGACTSEDGGKYQWSFPNGGVMLRTAEGIDPILLILDAKGMEYYRQEK